MIHVGDVICTLGDVHKRLSSVSSQYESWYPTIYSLYGPNVLNTPDVLMISP